ncbi:MAG TPA: phosphatidylserine decarboxylase [Stellaceae bacterium]|nr:phosphatidylserine decarboxylase [Stellaceae bacterium]
MLRRTLAPLHPDGWKFVAIAAVATIVLFVLWRPAGWAALVVTLWMAYFFRDPWRVTPTRPGLIVSPADGVVVSVGPAPPPRELAMGAEPLPRIGIFLNVFDVHVNRVPLAGRVAALRYTRGRFINASLDKASEHNERMAIKITTTDGAQLAFVQVAGLVARRIVCELIEGQYVASGQRMGLIRFGSRVDVYLPPGCAPLVACGQRVVGGETVLADRTAPEEAREGFAH